MTWNELEKLKMALDLAEANLEKAISNWETSDSTSDDTLDKAWNEAAYQRDKAYGEWMDAKFKMEKGKS